jgi:hypothetical protein
MKIYTPLLFLCFLSAVPNLLNAQIVSKKPYNIFHPVPKVQLRDMETDRPDVTESPFTVDAGHIQYETDLFKMEREKDELTDQHTVLLNQANLKIGLTNSTSLQIGFQTFVLQKEKDLETGEVTRSHGVGDMTIRIKQNLIGNDGGNFAIAVLPYIKFPTAKYTHESKYEGGIIVPMHLTLPGEWNLGSQIEGDRLQDKEGKQSHTELLQSLTVSHEIIKHLDGIAETYYTYNMKDHHWSNWINAAAQVEVSDNFKLDVGFNYGLQHDAEKNYFVGTSIRF